jgi:hypothetical protein
MKVPRVDGAPSLAHLADPGVSRPLPPAPGTVITQPTPPSTPPTPEPTAPWAGTLGRPMPPLVTLDGSVVPAPIDGVVHQRPPRPHKLL